MAARILLVVIACACILLASASPALARTFRPTRVLSDANMRTYDSMSVSQIQAFLAKRTGPLKRMSFPRHDNGSIAPASVIIWEAAQAWHISPKVLLTMLQKEQSLITRKTTSRRTLDRAVGAGCPDSGGNRYPGFGNQIWNGARLLDGYGETSKTTDYVPHPWVPRMANSFTRWVRTENLATYKLYVYNPSVGARFPYGDLSRQSCSGNANFWKIYWAYFGDPLSSPSSPKAQPGEYRTTVVLDRTFGSRRWDQPFLLSGRLRSEVPTAAPVEGSQVRLESFDGSRWTAIQDSLQTVGADGSFAYTLDSPSLERVRVSFAASGPLLPAVSGCFVCEAASVLSMPTAVVGTTSARPLTATGTLAPVRSVVVNVAAYRVAGGKRTFWKSFDVRTSAGGSWTLTTSLPRGEWKLQATQVDTTHSLAVSPWVSVIVS